ncbi:universal stress protein [Pigmentiphaga soli]|uniref:Universal stress protein n=1 Tax=Pigmentiphaga soli TaxID=1007095 RepID=A0ABP8H561_9BURK
MLGRIVVHIDYDSSCQRRVRAAARLAVEHGAELVGVYASFLQPQQAYEGIFVTAEIRSMLERRLVEECGRAQRLFFETAQEEGASWQWRTAEDLPERVLATQARYGDVLVMQQPSSDEPGPVRMPGIVASVILSAGRPVLVLPYAGEPATIGRRALVCWDGGREAARALADALPLLQRAEEVVLLTIDPRDDRATDPESETDDLATYCRSHGLPQPQRAIREDTGVSVGDAILNAASDYGSDLIVMGAYGHSQLRESILGGASRTLIESMTVPVLFSH